MTKPHSSEHVGNTAEKVGVVALFAGVLAVGAAFFKIFFNSSNKNKGE